MQHGVHGSSHSHESHCHQSCNSFQSPSFLNPNFHLSPCGCSCCCCLRSGKHFHSSLYKRMCKRGLTMLAKLFGSCTNVLNVPRYGTCGGKVWGLWVGWDNGLMILWACLNVEQFEVFFSIDQCHWSSSVAGYANHFVLNCTLNYWYTVTLVSYFLDLQQYFSIFILLFPERPWWLFWETLPFLFFSSSFFPFFPFIFLPLSWMFMSLGSREDATWYPSFFSLIWFLVFGYCRHCYLSTIPTIEVLGATCGAASWWYLKMSMISMVAVFKS